MARTTDEWQPKSDDTAIPDRVKLRVWTRAGGHCQICTRTILAGEEKHYDHVTPLADGGRHTEANLQIACKACHASKTADESKERAKVRSKAKAILGITRPAQSIKSPGFPVTEKAAKRQSKPPLPRRPLYRQESQNG